MQMIDGHVARKGMEVSKVSGGWQWTGHVMGRTFNPVRQEWLWSVAWEMLGPNDTAACDQTGLYAEDLTYGTP